MGKEKKYIVSIAIDGRIDIEVYAPLNASPEVIRDKAMQEFNFADLSQVNYPTHARHSFYGWGL